MTDDRADYLASSMNDHISKPIETYALRAALVRRIGGDRFMVRQYH
jgi:hypothetical protein